MQNTVEFRPVTLEDQEFLFQVYASTRDEELAPLGWDHAQREAFLEMQFTAQHGSYTSEFVDADFDIILLDDQPIGRLYVDRREDEIRLIDIALLPEHRNAGIGTALVRDLLEEAERSVKPVRLHVEVYNRARRLYQRLGFRTISDKGVYLFMEWLPSGKGGTA